MNFQRAILEAEDIGRRDGASYGVNPAALRQAEVGRFSAGASHASLTLRRALLTLDLPPGWLAWARRIGGERNRSRADKFLLRLAYWRGVREGLRDPDLWSALAAGPVILMYHAVGRDSEPPSCYVVPESRFREQMNWLARAGRPVISLGALIRHRAEGSAPPPGSVVLTFDDGYADNAEIVAPVLRRYGFPATIFVVSQAVGATPGWTSDSALASRTLLTTDQLRDLARSGLEIGAHTRTHPSLTDGTARDRLAFEITGSREDLEAILDTPVRTFAYPFGDHDEGVAAAVAAGGFDAACCSHSGINDPWVPDHELRRVEIRGTDSMRAFAWMLRRGHRPPPRTG